MNKFLSLACILFLFACNSKTDAPMDEVAVVEVPAAEIGDGAHIESAKAGLAALSSGVLDAWFDQFADDAMYRFNNGDSLAGKAAIVDYWTKRRGEDITAISFANDIWLPVKVNTPANEMQAPGDWLLGWYQVTATYKSGKSMTQWIHTDQHYNADGKVDIVIQYLDRASIMAAQSGK